MDVGFINLINLQSLSILKNTINDKIKNKIHARKNIYYVIKLIYLIYCGSVKFELGFKKIISISV